jgi:hypothetical protein
MVDTLISGADARLLLPTKLAYAARRSTNSTARPLPRFRCGPHPDECAAGRFYAVQFESLRNLPAGGQFDVSIDADVDDNRAVFDR